VTSTVRGWCPGALRPMQSGDGLIVRLKLRYGIVSVALARELARWSQAWGNGRLDLSTRGNLQLRGLSQEAIPHLQDALLERGILDPTPEIEAIRNVLCSPLAGLDPDAALDIRPVVAALEARLQSDPIMQSLPAKFGFVIDDGGSFSLRNERCDIRFEAVRTSHGPAFLAALGQTTDCFGPFHPDHVPDIAASLARCFITFRRDAQPELRRMQDLIALVGASSVAERSGILKPTPEQTGLNARDFPASQMHQLDRSRCSANPLGIHPMSNHGAALGVAWPFGQIDAAALATVATLAADHGANEIRLTPWRAILVPLPSQQAARGLQADLASVPVILKRDDPRLRIAACTGAPGCARATIDVRHDAAKIARMLPALSSPRIDIHVSGCAKGCAHNQAAPMTLTAVDGSYDVISNGRASDAPYRRRLSLEQAADQIRMMLGISPQTATRTPSAGSVR
jgi:precorrin-3B synthase